MDKIQFIQTSPEQLAELISEGVKNELQTVLKEIQNKNANEELLTREQLSKLLNVNLSTIWHWQKKGAIKAYGISGSRRYYKRSEIMEALKLLKK